MEKYIFNPDFQIKIIKWQSILLRPLGHESSLIHVAIYMVGCALQNECIACCTPVIIYFTVFENQTIYRVWTHLF
jgi:hypothetical protein